MNKDLIVKLAKLANNNPNDNEANAAARKVCRLLAEGNFNFGTPVQPVQPKETPKGGTWNDVERSKEPQWRSTPPPSPDYTNPEWGNWFENWYRDYFSYGGKDQQNPHAHKSSYYNPYESGPRKKSIHACNRCGRPQWLFNHMTNNYTCISCGYTISRIDAEANEWRMV